MPTFYVSQEFVETCRGAGYDPQKYINALLAREVSVTRKLKSSLSSELLAEIKKGV
jgi:hypothetical protein